MDIGSIVWFRQPAERTRAGTIRRGSINAAAAIEDQWREWAKGKIVSASDDGAGGMCYSIDKLHEVINVFIYLFILYPFLLSTEKRFSQSPCFVYFRTPIFFSFFSCADYFSFFSSPFSLHCI